MFLTDNIEISGKPQKNIVGFDYENVYTFAESKKKPLEGNTEMKNNLALTDDDVCAGFAVKVDLNFQPLLICALICTHSYES